MSVESLLAEIVDLRRGAGEADCGDLALRHGLPVEVVAQTVSVVEPGWERSPQSLALLLATTAKRVRTDPEENFAHSAVRGAAEVLFDQLWERWLDDGGEDATEGS